mgnify:CR=1 FL=1
MTEIQNIAYSMLELTDSIVRRKVKNSIVIAMYDRMVLPFFRRQIQNTPDSEIKKSLQLAYDNLSPLFEEADKLSDNLLSKNGLLREQSKYF